MNYKDFIEAFKNHYNYDDVDEKYFDNEGMIKTINEYIEDYEDKKPSKNEMAEFVYETLYTLEYGDTDDADDVYKINADINKRFPEGRKI